MKLKKGDNVKIISGNDKGKSGKILAALPRIDRIVVEGVNMKKKHMKPRQQGKKGELVRIPAPFPVSRAMFVCPKCNKPARIGYSTKPQGKERVCKKCGAEI